METYRNTAARIIRANGRADLAATLAGATLRRGAWDCCRMAIEIWTAAGYAGTVDILNEKII